MRESHKLQMELRGRGRNALRDMQQITTRDEGLALLASFRRDSVDLYMDKFIAGLPQEGREAVLEDLEKEAQKGEKEFRKNGSDRDRQHAQMAITLSNRLRQVMDESQGETH